MEQCLNLPSPPRWPKRCRSTGSEGGGCGACGQELALGTEGAMAGGSG